VNQSVYFQDIQGKKYFLFQVVNFGRNDELKFSFNVKKQGTRIVHSPDGSLTSENDTIRSYAEISYHNDGYMHYKLPKAKKGDKDDYRSRIKKIPLNQINEWEPVIKYTVVDYDICKKSKSSNSVLIPENDSLFNREPFECVIYLGNLRYANPPNNLPSEIIYRINDVAKNVDLIAWIYKSSYHGKYITIPNTTITVFNKGNIVQIVEKRRNNSGVGC